MYDGAFLIKIKIWSCKLGIAVKIPQTKSKGKNSIDKQDRHGSI